MSARTTQRCVAYVMYLHVISVQIFFHFDIFTIKSHAKGKQDTIIQNVKKQQIHLNLKDILIGLLTPGLPLRNYLLLKGNVFFMGV